MPKWPLRRYLAPLAAVLIGAGVVAPIGYSIAAAAETTAATPVPSAFSLRRAIHDAPSGATIHIPPGAYAIGDIKLPRDLTLIGNGAVLLYADGATSKGLLNPLPGVSLRLENIALAGARSPDLNGAGIRHDGKNLTLVNCLFLDNENGVLATGDSDGVIIIENTAFMRSGHGDGYSHGIYVVQARRLQITGSRFIGTKIGHHIKSLADETHLTGNLLDDDDGRTSYAVDLSKGGAVTIRQNRIIQATDSDNATMINYDLTRGGKAVSLIIEGNEIINRRRKANFLRVDAPLTPQIRGNKFQNEKGGGMAFPRNPPLNNR